MANSLILSYLPRGSVVHKLTGTTKLIVFLLFSVATMVTYDTRVLVVFLVMSLAIFKISRVRYRDVKLILWMAFVFLLLNNLFVYLFKPEYGVEDVYKRQLFSWPKSRRSSSFTASWSVSSVPTTRRPAACPARPVRTC